MAVVCRIVRVVESRGDGVLCVVGRHCDGQLSQEVEQSHAVAKAFSAAAAWIDDCDRAKGRLPSQRLRPNCVDGGVERVLRVLGGPEHRGRFVRVLCRGCAVWCSQCRRGSWLLVCGEEMPAVCSSMSRTHRGSRIKKRGASTVPLSPAWAFLPCTASLCVLCG